MKAIILNSGIGSRLGELTKDKPKCLVHFKNNNFLGSQIESLMRLGISEIIITTGPYENQIRDFVKTRFPFLKLIYINNPKYDFTNYIYSLWLTKNIIDEDILLLHGDMVFEEGILKKILDFPEKNCVLVNNGTLPPEKDFKARIENGEIREIGVNVFGEGCFFLAQIYKLSKEFFIKWLDKMEEFIKLGKDKVYAENALNELLKSRSLKLLPAYYSNELCMEVDDKEDLAIAREKLNFLMRMGRE